MQIQFDGSLIENRAGYEKWNPLNNIDKWATPQLVIHSDKDYRIPLAEGLMPFNILQVKGIKSKFLNFPDENHWYATPFDPFCLSAINIPNKIVVHGKVLTPLLLL